jgi:acylpyruvate hydrolase
MARAGDGVRFASCEAADERFAALVDGDRAIPLAGVAELGAATDLELLRNPPLRRRKARSLAEVRLLPVIPHPRKIICLGLNYRSHVTETKRELPNYPVLFTKFADCLTGPYEPIVSPPESTQVDYEAELAVIIGRHVRRVDERVAPAAIAGYAVANDVTMRDYQYRSHQWLQGKTWPGSTPLGPHLVTPDEVGDPGALEISLERNGEELQHAETSALLFPVPTIVARISEFTPLAPGDVILTGTPGGVGYRRDPQVFLEPGDRVTVDISRVGRISNTVIAEGGA